MVDVQKIEAFIAKRKVAFIASVDAQGFPALKAMLPPRRREGLRTFYFSTNTSSQRISQYRANPKASIYFYRKGAVHYEGVMLTGTMEVLEDADTKQAIWRVGDRIYYPKGVTDPDYCVLRFTARTGRHYRDLLTESFDISQI